MLAVDPQGRTVSGEIHHAPWKLHTARLQIRENTLGAGFDLELRTQPEHVAFCGVQEAVFWRPRRGSK